MDPRLPATTARRKEGIGAPQRSLANRRGVGAGGSSLAAFPPAIRSHRARASGTATAKPCHKKRVPTDAESVRHRRGRGYLQIYTEHDDESITLQVVEPELAGLAGTLQSEVGVAGCDPAILDVFTDIPDAQAAINGIIHLLHREANGYDPRECRAGVPWGPERREEQLLPVAFARGFPGPSAVGQVRSMEGMRRLPTKHTIFASWPNSSTRRRLMMLSCSPRSGTLVR